jgi:hypothetical protein
MTSRRRAGHLVFPKEVPHNKLVTESHNKPVITQTRILAESSVARLAAKSVFAFSRRTE